MSDFTGRVGSILEKLLVKDVDIRYQQGRELVRDLAESINA